MSTKKTVADYIAENTQWQEVIIALKDIIYATELKETIKWGMPTYTLEGKNVITIGAFKNYVALWFIQGVFLEDKYPQLLNAQKGKTKAMRHWRFTKLADIDAPLVTACIADAIQNQKEGKEVKFTTNNSTKERKPLLIPDLLQEVFDTNPEVKSYFDALKLTQKRNLCNFINQAKRLETKQKRIKRIIPLILEGKGIYE